MAVAAILSDVVVFVQPVIVLGDNLFLVPPALPVVALPGPSGFSRSVPTAALAVAGLLDGTGRAAPSTSLAVAASGGGLSRTTSTAVLVEV